MKYIDWFRVLSKLKAIKREVQMQKKWYASKTLWVNLIATIVIVVQSYTGFFIDPILQGYILAGINLLLRLITKEEIVWSVDK